MASPPLYNIFSRSSSPKKKAIDTAKPYRKFNFYFLLATFLPVLLAGLFNFAIDPYDVFDTPDILGINHSKPKKDNNDRLFKATDIIRLKPVTVFIGSSRTKQGLDPDYVALKDYQPAYNLAINGPNVYEVKRYLQHAIANQKDLKEVVLGIDFFMFNANLDNQPTFSENRLEKQYLTWQDLINSLFSIDTLSASQSTIADSLKEPNPDTDYGENGFMPNRNINDGNTKWRFNQSIKLYYSLHSNYQFSDKYFSDFQEIVELCRRNGIELKVFISPSHATNWETIREIGQWESFEQWKRKMVQIVPVWDFSGYNSITTEKIADKMQKYADNSHYTPKIGNLILDRLFEDRSENLPEDFGVLMTPENIDSHLAKIRRDREIWAKNRPEEVKLVKNLKRQANPSQK